MKTIYLALMLFIPLLGFGQRHTISGYVEDANTGEKLIGVNIYDLNTGEGTVSNTYGFYSLTLPEGEVEVVYSYISYKSGIQKLTLTEDNSINVALLEESEIIDEITITADQVENNYERTQMSTIDVPIAQIKKIPPLLGEVDVIKALQLLPGVQSGGEGQSGLYVRGGSPDQNLVLLDGTPVYNASHLFGFFSVFNADALKEVKLIKGGFPARYGGRLSSVLDINMKEGNNQELHGTASIGLISSKLMLEGPINKGKTSFMVSGRRTYIDLLARPFIKKQFKDDNKDGKTGYFFYDLNAKVNHTFSDKDRLYFSVYTGLDKFYLDTKDLADTGSKQVNNFGWGNITSALRWNHVWSPKLFSNTTLTYSRFDLNILTKLEDFSPQKKTNTGLEYTSGIDDYAGAIDFDYLPNSKHTIKFGLHGIKHTFNPGKFDLEQNNENTDFSKAFTQPKVKAFEGFAYVEDDWEITDNLKANIGLHYSAFNVNKKTYNSIQPRLGVRMKLGNGVALKGSFATMRQYINLLTSDGIGLPTDLWLPSTDKIRPQESWQTGLGISKSLDNGYEIAIEGYYKEMKNLIAYKEGQGIFGINDWQERITQGKGDSYGVELFVQKKKGKLSGWLGYTLSWSNRQFDELNLGKEFDFKYDRRHDFSVVAMYKLSDRINFGGTWVYGTGNAVTLGQSNYTGFYGSNTNLGSKQWQGTEIKERNNYRMGAYHRLDLGVNFERQRAKYKRTLSVGAYNVYVRKNPFFLYVDTNTKTNEQTGEQTKTRILKQTSLFPIIPYITYKIDF